jgi:hypothetical protein
MLNLLVDGLSVVGTDRLLVSGYFRAKMPHANLIQASGIPSTIGSATLSRRWQMSQLMTTGLPQQRSPARSRLRLHEFLSSRAAHPIAQFSAIRLALSPCSPRGRAGTVFAPETTTSSVDQICRPAL